MFRGTFTVAALASFALAAVSCSAPRAERAQDEPARAPTGAEQPRTEKARDARPWTRAFGSKAALVGDEVTIEGPPGLLDHVLVQQDPQFFTLEQKATPDGFACLTEVKPDAAGAPPIRVRIDAWTIDALARVRVLEKPGECSVIVQVSGDAWYRELSSGAEQRSAVLRFVGERP
jgi:hypothetical protein